ncbi:MAG: CAP domain-containing protein [Asticcacaulis sp.]|nr:CAP domain-containing protein [Asticcacaulis sp.]
MRTLALLTAACAGLVCSHADARPRGPEGDVLAMINAERVRHGCQPLRVETRLSEAAERQSRGMATRHYFSHNAPDGSTPGKRVKDTGYVYQMVGENIELNSEDPEAVVSTWMNSPGHRQNILMCAFRETGIAMYQADDTGTYWTQVFAMPLNLGR